jgi:hypothetical protein
MPATKQEQKGTAQEHGTRNAALTAVAAAAATGAASYALRKALSPYHDASSEHDEAEGTNGERKGKSTAVLASAASSAWEAASQVIVPLTEEAADAAGRYVAEHAPDVVRERIVPRFIESFNDAS